MNFIVNGGDFGTVIVNSLQLLCLPIANFYRSCSPCCCIWISCSGFPLQAKSKYL